MCAGAHSRIFVHILSVAEQRDVFRFRLRAHKFAHMPFCTAIEEHKYGARVCAFIVRRLGRETGKSANMKSQHRYFSVNEIYTTINLLVFAGKYHRHIVREMVTMFARSTHTTANKAHMR